MDVLSPQWCKTKIDKIPEKQIKITYTQKPKNNGMRKPSSGFSPIQTGCVQEEQGSHFELLL